MPTRVAGVRRGPEKSHINTSGEWRAHYAFALTPPPPKDWREIFHNLIFGVLGWVEIRDDTVSLFADPDRLQLVVEEINRVCLEADRRFSDLSAHPEVVEAFERDADRAIERLVFPGEDSNKT